MNTVMALVAAGWLIVAAFLLYYLLEFALNLSQPLPPDQEYQKWKEDSG